VDPPQSSIRFHLHNNIRSHGVKTARWQRAENHADKTIQVGIRQRRTAFRLKGGFLLALPSPRRVEVGCSQLPELIETPPGGFVVREHGLQLQAPLQLLRR
jgi:hypothetical protein